MGQQAVGPKVNLVGRLRREVSESRDLEVDHRDEPVHLIITCRRDQPQIQEGAQACHVNRRSQASVEEEVMKDRPAVSLEVNRGHR